MKKQLRRKGQHTTGHRSAPPGSHRYRQGTGAASVPATDFVARAPWWGGDLQTLHNLLPRSISERLVDKLPLGASKRLRVSMEDGSGGSLLALLDQPGDGAARPLVVLIHGLTGCEDSLYMRASAAHFLALGYPVLRLNLRGAGPSRFFCRFRYHARAQ